MAKHELSDFPRLLEAIGDFLRDLERQGFKNKKLKPASRAYMESVTTLYPYPARLYRCTAGPSRVPIITTAYVCNKISRIKPSPLSREAK